MDDKAGDNKQASALQWDGRDAPRVVASGEGVVAEHIIEVAKANDVPLVQDLSLSALLSNVDVGDEIPESLFYVVATVLAYVYKVNNKPPPVVVE